MGGQADAPTVARLLRDSALPTLDARALLSHVTGLRRESLIAAPARPVSTADAARFSALAARRRSGEPLAYLLGTREFYGRPFRVTPAVLVPRPETELLVDLALDALDAADAVGAVSAVASQSPPRVLDLGTGSGCIAISVALARPAAQVAAVDASADALAIAQANADALGAQVAFAVSDWFAAVRGRFDLLLANPPYIAADDPHLAALAHEPRTALTDDADGLDCLRVITREAPRYLAAGGTLMVEHGHDQAAAVRALFQASGLQDVRSVRDAAGIERVCLGRWVGPQAPAR
jgi:release factor glutamine methyltransferase